MTPGDLFSKIIRCRHRQGGDDAKATRIGDAGRHFGKSYIVHSALNDRMLDFKKFSNAGFHLWSFSFKFALVALVQFRQYTISTQALNNWDLHGGVRQNRTVEYGFYSPEMLSPASYCSHLTSKIRLSFKTLN